MKDPYSITETIVQAPVLPIYSNANSIVSAKKKKTKSKTKSKKIISNSKPPKPVKRTKPVPRQRVKPITQPVLSPLMETQVYEPQVYEPPVMPVMPVKRVQPKPKPRARVKPAEPIPKPIRVIRPFNLLEPTQRIQLKPKQKTQKSVFFKANASNAPNATLKKQILLQGTRVNRTPDLKHPLLKISLKTRKAIRQER